MNNTVGAFVRSYAGHLITGAITLVATSSLVWDNHKGRRDAVEKLDATINGVKAEVGSVKAEVGSVKADVGRVEKNLEDLGAELQDFQSLILQISLHTMQALDGDKKPMREWVENLEHCVQSGGKDCGSTLKA